MSSTTIDTAQDAAEIAYDWFEQAKRPGDSDDTFTRTKDGAPEWITDLVREAHGSFLPDDWRYDCIHNAVEFIRDTDEPEASEFADQQIDTYTGSRFLWLSSDLKRAGYCDDALNEFGCTDETSIIDIVGMGQYMEACEVFYSVLASLEARIGEDSTTSEP